MKGSIRMLVGFLIMAGAIGTLDADPNASVVTQGLIALVGAVIMYSGVNAMNSHRD